MMTHIKYRFKALLNDKVLLFWTLFFPMLLAIFFNSVLRDAFSNNPLKAIQVAVVETTEYQEDVIVQSLLDALEENEIIVIELFKDETTALEALENNTVSAIITPNEQVELTFNSSGLSQTILVSIFDNYNQQRSMIENIIYQNPDLLNTNFIQESLEIENYITEANNQQGIQVYVIYFYTIMAMMCLYGAHWGLKSSEHLQANNSTVAIRTNIAPTNKMKLVLMDLLSVFAILLFEFLVLFAFIRFGLNVDFGSNYLVIILVSLAGMLMSISLGYFIGIYLRTSESARTSVVTSVTLVFCFLAGMQIPSTGYLIRRYLPFLAYLNPASLITDSYYITYYYQDMSRAYLNIGLLLLYAVLIGIAAYRKLKGVNYDSI